MKMTTARRPSLASHLKGKHSGGGGGGSPEVLQLNGENLQLNGEDLTLGS